MISNYIQAENFCITNNKFIYPIAFVWEIDGLKWFNFLLMRYTHYLNPI
jgi:hypothetical protein